MVKRRITKDESGNSSGSEDYDETNVKPKNMYIIKPGENTNRGNGIIVCHTLQEIR